MENMTPTSMTRLLNGKLERRVSTSHDTFSPEEITRTQMIEDGSYIKYTNQDVGQTWMDTYNEWQPQRLGVPENSGETSALEYIVCEKIGRVYCR